MFARIIGFLLWVGPALADTFSDDIGQHYAIGLAFIMAVAAVCVVLVPILLVVISTLIIGKALLVALMFYIAFGGVYNRYQRFWSM
jgi:hypothetical protein